MRALLVVPVVGTLAACLLTPVGAAVALIAPDTQCRSGRVALTFDDGPHPEHTRRLLKVLRRHRAQVTFYVQGQRAEAQPGLLRTMVRDGHAVENHSWDHPRLTDLSAEGVRSQLARTTRAIRQATGRTPEYFRPPYGATSDRVVAVAREARLEQQLWTVDSRDWTGLSGAAIADRVIGGVRKNRRNVVLLHDGVTNSPRTIDAVPTIVKTLRERGHCLRPQQQMMALQRVRVRGRKVTEPTVPSVVVTFAVTLDSPSQRRGRVRLTAVDGTATAGRHYGRRPIWVRFARGQSTSSVKVRIFRVPDENATRWFSLRLGRPHHLVIPKRKRVTKVVIGDNGVVASAPSPTPAPPVP